MARCISTLFSRPTSVRREGSGISSAVTIHGPKPPVPMKFFPGVNWLVCRCQSRRVASW